MNEILEVSEVAAKENTHALSAKHWLGDPLGLLCTLNVLVVIVGRQEIFIAWEHRPKQWKQSLVSKNELPERLK